MKKSLFVVRIAVAAVAFVACLHGSVSAQSVIRQSGFLGGPTSQTYDGGKYFLRYDQYLRSDRTYTIKLNSNSFDTYLILADSSNRTLQTNDDGGPGLNSRIVFQPNRTGTYRIYVTSFRANEKGSFNLEVISSNAANGIQKPANNQTFLTRDAVRKIATSACNAAHPTGRQPTLVSFHESMKNGVHILTAEVRYYGLITGNGYDATVVFRTKLPDDLNGTPVLQTIDFLDRNNAIRPNYSNLDRLRRDVNAGFRTYGGKGS